MGTTTRFDRTHRVMELRSAYRAAAARIASQGRPARSVILLGLILASLDDTPDECGAR